MAIILADASGSGVALRFSGRSKVRIARPGFTGAVEIVATCVGGGLSSAVEPLWADLETSASFLDNTVSWKVTTIPAVPSIPHWIAGHTYAVGTRILSRTVHVKLASVQTLQIPPYRPSSKRDPVALNNGRLAHAHQKAARLRRVWLSGVWFHSFNAGDRADWNALATGFTATNFKGKSKVFSGWQLFERCWLGVYGQSNQYPISLDQWDMSLPSEPDAKLQFGALQFVGGASDGTKIISASYLGGGVFTLGLVSGSPPLGISTLGVIDYYGFMGAAGRGLPRYIAHIGETNNNLNPPSYDSITINTTMGWTRWHGALPVGENVVAGFRWITGGFPFPTDIFFIPITL